MADDISRPRYPILVIGIVAFIVVVPMMLFGNAWGHDFDFHFPAWLETEHQFRSGIIYSQWAAGSNYGFGQPFFVFDPPLSRTIAATLGLILPWKMVPGAYVWLVLLLAGMAMRKCASQWLTPSSTLMASLAYVVNPFLIVTAYRRTNYAELLATALFPLLVWASIQIGREGRKAVFPLSLTLAVIWLSDLPAAVIATYCVAFFLVLISLMHRSLRTLLYGALAIGGGFGSIAFFMLPAAWERKWVNISDAVRPDWAPENNFLFNRPMNSFTVKLSFIALLLVASGACAAFFGRRWRHKIPDVWYPVAALGGVCAFMMVSPSLIFYRLLPEMRYVQFPWRWLSPLCVVVVLLVSFSIEITRRKWAAWAGVFLALAGLGAAILRNVSWDSGQHLKELVATVQSAAGYPDLLARWSDPLGSQPLRLPTNAPLIAAVSTEDENEVSAQDVQIQTGQWSPEHKNFSVDSPRRVLLKIKLLSYPAWHGLLNGSEVPLKSDQTTGQMLLPVPAGVSRVEIKFVRTWDRTAGMVVSLITILMISLFKLLRRRREGTRAHFEGEGN
jgi:hypothetical protein